MQKKRTKRSTGTHVTNPLRFMRIAHYTESAYLVPRLSGNHPYRDAHALIRVARTSTSVK